MLFRPKLASSFVRAPSRRVGAITQRKSIQPKRTRSDLFWSDKVHSHTNFVSSGVYLRSRAKLQLGSLVTKLLQLFKLAPSRRAGRAASLLILLRPRKQIFLIDISRGRTPREAAQAAVVRLSPARSGRSSSREGRAHNKLAKFSASRNRVASYNAARTLKRASRPSTSC